MKKVLIFISAAALLFAACTKVEEAGREVKDQEITFQTAMHVTKAPVFTGSVFPTTETFSVYAWTDASALPNSIFMDDVTVAFNGTDWKTQGGTYYWPKSAPVDFIAYYPTGMNGITVAPKKVTYTDIDVEAGQEDIMYTDKAVGFSNNVDLIADGVKQYTGVPLIFRHALAKVKVVIELVYNHKEEADGTVTDWEVTLNSFKMKDIFSKGSCELNLSTTPAEGIVTWERPADAVWTPNGDKVNIASAISSEKLEPRNADGTVREYLAVGEHFVLPQALAAASQQFELNLTINTKRNGTVVLSETFDRTPDITLTSIPAWEMNHIYTYRLRITPTASDGNGGQPYDPSDPNNPGPTNPDPNNPGHVDPNNPNLDDVIITFDPAVDGWDNVNVEAVLNI